MAEIRARKLLDSLHQEIVAVVHPYLRRKDAGYLANVLADYALWRAQGTRKLSNAAEVEKCYAALCMPADASNWAVATGTTFDVALPGDNAQATPDDYASKVWLQNYMRQIFILETAVLDLQDFPTLVARAPMLLARYAITTGTPGDKIRLQNEAILADDKLQESLKTWYSASPDKRIETEDPIRSRLRMLLADVHWWYGQSQVREELFLGQQITVICTFLAISVVLLVVYAAICGSCGNRAVAIGMFFGMLGAFTSIMRRMRSDAEQHGGGSESSYKELTALAYGKIGIGFGLVFGIIFSLVLMLLFSSGLTTLVFNEKMAATVFPSLPLTCEQATCAGYWCCLFDLPVKAPEFAKLMVWSFLAGFAEQLVPDALDRLTRAADVAKAK